MTAVTPEGHSSVCMRAGSPPPASGAIMLRISWCVYRCDGAVAFESMSSSSTGTIAPASSSSRRPARSSLTLQSSFTAEAASGPDCEASSGTMVRMAPASTRLATTSCASYPCSSAWSRQKSKRPTAELRVSSSSLMSSPTRLRTTVAESIPSLKPSATSPRRCRCWLRVPSPTSSHSCVAASACSLGLPTRSVLSRPATTLSEPPRCTSCPGGLPPSPDRCATQKSSKESSGKGFCCLLRARAATRRRRAGRPLPGAAALPSATPQLAGTMVGQQGRLDPGAEPRPALLGGSSGPKQAAALLDVAMGQGRWGDGVPPCLLRGC
mmetsp:Transcript_1636/g.3992  ORF Transcript_1636/g.3992 Transcript_1636/m.3992 type:complete len:324 (+) Transcript_1636:129-1100(+)